MEHLGSTSGPATHERRPQRFGRRSRVGIIAAAGLLASAMTAVGDTATISINDTSGRPDPVVNIARVFTVTGNVPAPARVWIKHREPGGAPCAPTFYSDSGDSVDGFGSWEAPNANGNFSFSQVLTWSNPGPEMYCIWLPAGGSGDTITTPISQIIDFRSPVSTVGVQAAASPVPVSSDFRVTISGSTEASTSLYASLANPGAACAATFSADRNAELVSGTDVNGAFSIVATGRSGAAGDYGVCVWIASSSYDTSPGAGPQRLPLRVGAPSRPAVAVTPTSLSVSFPRGIRLRRIVPVTAIVSSGAGIPRGTCFVQRYIARNWENIASSGVSGAGVCRMTIRMGRRGTEQLRVRFRGAGGYGSSVTPFSNVRVR